MHKIALITPCYNAPAELIHQHFFSLEKQGHVNKDILHIVVDDNSTDLETRAALLWNADHYKEYTVLIGRTENGGPGAARNRAIESIEKLKDIQYICLLDADDYLEPDSIQLRKNILDEDDSYIAVYGNKYTAKYGPKKDELDNKVRVAEVSKTLEVVPDFDKARLFRECYIPSCSVMFRAKPFLQYVKRFREDVRLCEDWLIWRKLALLGQFKKINMPVYTQTLHGSNLTTNPDVLRNHLKDMVTTRADLDQWVRDNMNVVLL